MKFIIPIVLFLSFVGSILSVIILLGVIYSVYVLVYGIHPFLGCAYSVFMLALTLAVIAFEIDKKQKIGNKS